MGQMNAPRPSKIIVPDHLKEQHAGNIAAEIDAKAKVEEEKAHKDFDQFCRDHNVRFLPFNDVRFLGDGIKPMGSGIYFISNIRTEPIG